MREYYAFAMIAGFSYTEARRQLPGMVLDIYKARAEYDVKVNGGKAIRRTVK